jgi:hypothetical protein
MPVRTFIGCYIILTILGGCDKFKESFKKNFVSSCTESAIKSGAPEDDAKNKCECVATFLVNNYSSSELMKLNDPKSPESSKMFDKAVSSCRDVE